ncbi:hypothetical protein AK812_SmicGene47949, partial [Symbiodinium microadriaticum]
MDSLTGLCSVAAETVKAKAWRFKDYSTQEKLRSIKKKDK